MHKIKHKVIIPVFIILFLMLVGAAHGQNPATATTTINVDLASFVANQYVHKYYPGFQWLNVDHMTLHDINGYVQAYAFVFAVSGSDFHSSDDLRRHIQEKSAILVQAKEEQASADQEAESVKQARVRVIDAEEALYNFRTFATIITGATSDNKLILRHFRGIPEFWVSAETPNESTTLEQSGTSQQVTHIVMITPMDFRLVVTESGGAKPLSTTMRSSQRTTFSNTAQILGTRASKVRSVAEMRKKRQAIVNRKQQRFNTLEPAERARYEKALQDRAKAMADKWQLYREMQTSYQKGKEVAK